jgi:hypothetical protein
VKSAHGTVRTRSQFPILPVRTHGSLRRDLVEKEVVLKRLTIAKAATIGVLTFAAATSGTTSCSRSVTIGSAIGPDGGTVNGPDGVRVLIPAGALTQSMPITIQEVAAASAPAPSGMVYAGHVYSFEPHGLSFAKPVQIFLPFNGSQAPVVLHSSCLSGSAGSAQCKPWDAPVSGVVIEGTSAVVSTSTFSLYAPARPNDGGMGGAAASSVSATTDASTSSGSATSSGGGSHPIVCGATECDSLTQVCCSDSTFHCVSKGTPAPHCIMLELDCSGTDNCSGETCCAVFANSPPAVAVCQPTCPIAQNQAQQMCDAPSDCPAGTHCAFGPTGTGNGSCAPG